MLYSFIITSQQLNIAGNTAFTTENLKYEFPQTPFGIHIAPSYVTLVINETLKRLELCFAYQNDITTFSESEKAV